MTTSLMVTESSLTVSSKTFTENVEHAGWVEKNSAFSLIQSKLFRMGDKATAKLGYAARLVSDSANASDMFDTLTADVSKVTLMLTTLDEEARVFMKDASKNVGRAEVLAFEGALVSARKAGKSFQEACSELRQQDAFLADEAEAQLGELDAEIAKAGDLADRLAIAWQSADQDLS